MPRRKAVTADEAADYKALYEEASATVQAMQQDLEVANNQIQVMRQDYDDALAKNQDMASRLHQLEDKLADLTKEDVIEVGEGMVRVLLDSNQAEIKTTLGPGGEVTKTRSLCINGKEYKYACDEQIEMPVDHARLLGAI